MASEAQASAAVILARAGAGGVEIFMVKRPTIGTYADVWVFPGGAVQACDREAAHHEPDFGPDDAWLELSRRGGTPPADSDTAMAIHRAAVRELFEEAGVLLTRSRGGGLDADPAVLRRAVHAGDMSMAEALRRLGAQPDYQRLVYYSHWVTPETLPRRFDTRFFVAVLPAGQVAAHCGIETTDGAWVVADAALAELPLVFPTRMHLRRLRAFSSVDDLLAEAGRKSIRTVRPTRADDPTVDETSW